MQITARKTHADAWLTAILLGLFFLFVTHISRLSEGVVAALALCARAIIPTLFPFFILTDLLLSVKSTERVLTLFSRPLAKLLRLSPSGGAAVLLGAVFGFPMGAKAISHYYSSGILSKEESERLLLFSGNASPFFLIGSVGHGMLFSPKMGLILYLIQITVSLVCGILLGILSPRNTHFNAKIALEDKKISLPQSLRGAVRQSLFVSGYVVFFSAILSILLPYIKHAFVSCLFASLLEIGSACALVSQSGTYAIPFCAFSACFSGLSVYFQTLDCIEGLELQTQKYLPIKLLCGAGGFFLALPLV